MRRGLTLGETTLALAVLILFFAILLPIYFRSRSSQLEDLDTGRMRQIYVALSLYESGNEGAPSPTIAGARPYLSDNTPFLSDEDPWAEEAAPRFPLDPELPKSAATSPYRISYSYLLDFVGPAGNHADKWRTDLVDPRVGLLSDSWHGSVTQTGAPFTARFSGPVLRVNTDGSLFRLRDRGGSGEMGDWNALFYAR